MNKKRSGSFLLALLFCFISVAHVVFYAQADEPEHPPVDASGITYEWDAGAGFYIGLVEADFEPQGGIDVPGGYHLVMDDNTGSNDLAGTTVSLADGAYLDIFGGASFAGTLTASQGAGMNLGGEDNAPDGVTLYDADGVTPYSWGADGECFVYDGSQWAKWEEDPGNGNDPDNGNDPSNGNDPGDDGDDTDPTEPDDGQDPPILRTAGDQEEDLPPLVMLNIGGYDGNHDSVTVEYKYSGNTYTVVDYMIWGGGDNYPCDIFGGCILASPPDNWNDQVDIKLTLTSARTPTPAIIAAVNFEYDGGMDELSNHITNNGTVFEGTVDLSREGFLGVSLSFPNAGDPAITEKANDYLYAYYSANPSTIKNLFAEELICRLMDPSMFEYFGMPETNDNNRAGNVTELASRIEENGVPYSVTATKPDGSTTNVSVQNYTVNWGNSIEDGHPVTSILPVYTLSNANEILICTDFNDRNGQGSHFLLGDASAAETTMATGGVHGVTGICFRVDSVNPATIKAGGMGLIETTLNDEGLYTMEVTTGGQAAFLRVSNPVMNYRKIIRLIKSSEKYVSVQGTGENKNYGLIGDNGNNCDEIWATGNNTNATARVYVGDSTIHINPLDGATGMSGTDILSVTLEDPSQADGVTLNTSNLSDVTLSFASNFYSEIPLRITFTGGVTRFLTIHRVGLVIQYVYLAGNPNEDEGGNNGEIRLDYRGESIPYTYNYFSGEQIAVWATYYHPTIDPTQGNGDCKLYLSFNNGTHRVVDPVDTAHNFDGSKAATLTAVAATSFLIGFEQARDYFDGYVWIGQRNETNYHEGGFYATVLNEGYNDNTTYSGTQMGSGKGVYWNGHISFYR